MNNVSSEIAYNYTYTMYRAKVIWNYYVSFSCSILRMSLAETRCNYASMWEEKKTDRNIDAKYIHL